MDNDNDGFNAASTDGNFADYLKEWGDSQDLSPDELHALGEEDIMFSADYSEATYRMPHAVMHEQNSVISELLSGFKPWRVFEHMFVECRREVNMMELIRKGYWDGPETVVSTCGSFMGDGMSFIHLTLMLGGCLEAACQSTNIPRPLGQQVGDDLFLMKTKFHLALAFCQVSESLNCKFSKINSISEDSGTFCEQYFAMVINRSTYKGLKAFEDSLFGDVFFLDTIKGSCLGNQSKVKSDDTDPFIGHAKMLGKQTKYHPSQDVTTRSKTLLWASNYRAAQGLSSSMASLPYSMGGAEMALGTGMTFESNQFQAKLPYYEAMTALPDREFFYYSTLLRGVYQAAPKGIPWLNDENIVREVANECKIYNFSELEELMPENIRTSSFNEKKNYAVKELRVLDLFFLVDILARQNAFLKQWNHEVPKDQILRLNKNCRQRANHVWAIIKSDITPVSVTTCRSINDVDDLLRRKSKDCWIRKSDPVIQKVFEGMPLLEYDNDSTIHVRERKRKANEL